jgi:L-lactate dehydrogenase complex protein LldE
MHIGGGLSRLRAGVRTLHLAEILASTEEEPWRAQPATR